MYDIQDIWRGIRGNGTTGFILFVHVFSPFRPSTAVPQSNEFSVPRSPMEIGPISVAECKHTLPCALWRGILARGLPWLARRAEGRTPRKPRYALRIGLCACGAYGLFARLCACGAYGSRSPSSVHIPLRSVAPAGRVMQHSTAVFPDRHTTPARGTDIRNCRFRFHSSPFCWSSCRIDSP